MPSDILHQTRPDTPLAGTPDLVFPHENTPAPDEAACLALWDRYEMLDNVRAHSRLVAKTATALAVLAKAKGLPVDVAEVTASGLLHDLAKTYCIRHGGGHASLGASWVVQETGNHAVAQGVFHHVWWPWALPVDDPARICSLPFFIIYADKRARHDVFVSLEKRFEDLLVRYGGTAEKEDGIRLSFAQAQAIEDALSRHLGIRLADVAAPEAITARAPDNAA